MDFSSSQVHFLRGFDCCKHLLSGTEREELKGDVSDVSLYVIRNDWVNENEQ